MKAATLRARWAIKIDTRAVRAEALRLLCEDKARRTVCGELATALGIRPTHGELVRVVRQVAAGREALIRPGRYRA